MPATTARHCEWCGNEFRALLKEVKRGKGRLCSVSCANAKRSADKRDPDARKKWLERNKGSEHYQKQRKAHHAVEEAVKRNRLQRKPCEICGSTERIHAHHDDYDKPLSVRWLCVAHHRQLHG